MISRLRAIAIVIGFVCVLALAIAWVDSLSQLYATIALSAPWLANLVVVLIVVAIAGCLAFGVYMLFRWFGPTRSRKANRNPLKRPTTKAAAVNATLEAVGERLGQLQDSDLQANIRERVQALAAQLSRREWRVVVFGTGSAGKTSLVNALLGQMVGSVGATMGTTAVGATYELNLIGLERKIFLTDTPGILEAGAVGAQRMELAETLAKEADLLLFVVDNDLHRAEYEPLQALAALGKRSLLAFNKVDLYTDTDRASVLQSLRDRLAGTVATTDIVPVAANPQPVTLTDGSVVQPEPDLILLIQRLAAILRDDGEILVADNVLLQAQQLGETMRELLDRQRQAQAENLVRRYQWISAGAVAATPLPVVDMIAAAAINAQMVRELGRIYGCDLDWERAQELARSLGKTMVGLGIVRGAIELLTTVLELSVAAYFAGKAIQGITAAYLTRIAGKSFIAYFRQDQDWGDGGMAAVVREQFRLERQDEFVKGFVREAITRVVEPLQAERSPEEALRDDWQEPRRTSKNW
ncbi:MAG: GTP-binding protein [Cyanobacteria bacterium J06641_5]